MKYINTKIHIFDFQYNKIVDISSMAFGKLPVVFELDLSDNQISNLR